jgi:hypothetical protein
LLIEGELDEVFGKCRSIVGLFNHSNIMNQELAELQKRKNNTKDKCN